MIDQAMPTNHIFVEQSQSNPKKDKRSRQAKKDEEIKKYMPKGKSPAPDTEMKMIEKSPV